MHFKHTGTHAQEQHQTLTHDATRHKGRLIEATTENFPIKTTHPHLDLYHKTGATIHVTLISSSRYVLQSQQHHSHYQHDGHLYTHQLRLMIVHLFTSKTTPG